MLTELSFHKSIGTKKQPDVFVYKNSVFLRKNHQTVEQDGQTFWVCDEAIITVDEFNEYTDFISRQNAFKGINDSDSIASLLSGQSESEFNLLAAMEATADLYELMSTNEFNQLAIMEAIADLYEAQVSGGAA